MMGCPSEVGRLVIGRHSFCSFFFVCVWNSVISWPCVVVMLKKSGWLEPCRVTVVGKKAPTKLLGWL